MAKEGNDAYSSAIMRNMAMGWYSRHYLKVLLPNFVASLYGTLFLGPPIQFSSVLP